MHEGHRSRMYDKLLSDAKLFDHELLEILLFNAFPRVNTNPIAHALLDKFGSVHAVINARFDELITVSGIGESVAHYLCIVGNCAMRAAVDSGSILLNNFEACKIFSAQRLKDRNREYLEFYFIAKSGVLQRVYSFTSNERGHVRFSADKLIDLFKESKPFGVCIAHNHLDGNSKPSELDDEFTKSCLDICRLNKVNLLDHCIYAKGAEIFSYRSSERLLLLEGGLK